jgi:hypothetical protein
MSTKEIIQSIKQLPFNERLIVIEKALKTLHESADKDLNNAAKVLMFDYETDKELIAFTDIDFDKFYEAR